MTNPPPRTACPMSKTALDGARDILSERFAETAELLAKLRTRMWEQGVVTSKVMKDKESAEDGKVSRLLCLQRNHSHHSFPSRVGFVSRSNLGRVIRQSRS